ncbi:MAG TPA: phage tail protein [Syntrophobacteria bacterium]|nr:phage tail protein [Syntrophobacteria bacterium]
MPNDQAKYPNLAAFFRVEVQSLTVGGFSECTGLQVETEVEEHREGGLNEYSHKLPKGSKYGTITLKRGFINSDELWTWNQNVVAGVSNQRKDISIILTDRQGQDICRWNVSKALPVKWNSSEFKADANTILVETLELVHHGFAKA